MSNRMFARTSATGELAAQIIGRLEESGKDIQRLTTRDLASVDEFHFRGRHATLELAEKMRLTSRSKVLDIGSGLGGPARTIAHQYRCRVTGVDVTPAFCEAAQEMSGWVRLSELVHFTHGDALELPFEDASFDAAMSIHVAMAIEAKDQLYAEAKRVLKDGSIFAVYDVVKGEGGAVRFPVPWARTPDISHLATPDRMKALLRGAGFKIIEIKDSTAESQKWFEETRLRNGRSAGRTSKSFHALIGKDFPGATQNQIINLGERRIRTVTYVCEA